MEITMAKAKVDRLQILEAQLQMLETKFIAMSAREDKILNVLQGLDNRVLSLDAAICPRVAARLTALERRIGQPGLVPPATPVKWPTNRQEDGSGIERAVNREPAFARSVKVVATLPPDDASDALLWNVTYSYGSKLSQHKLRGMIAALQRVYLKRNI
jgi:hypothetical protein